MEIGVGSTSAQLATGHSSPATGGWKWEVERVRVWGWGEKGRGYFDKGGLYRAEGEEWWVTWWRGHHVRSQQAWFWPQVTSLLWAAVSASIKHTRSSVGLCLPCRAWERLANHGRKLPEELQPGSL